MLSLAEYRRALGEPGVKAVPLGGAVLLERKDAPMIAAASVDASPDEPVVTIISSVTGVEDLVGDIIEPGAYEWTLGRLIPKVAQHHKRDVLVGRVERSQELLPGDPRLPATTKGGEPWPAHAGLLAHRVRFNTETQAGREAWSDHRFHGGNTEWSIGYEVPRGGAVKDRRGVRHISRLLLREISPVMWGAHPQVGVIRTSKKHLPGQHNQDNHGGDGAPSVVTSTRRAGSPASKEPKMTKPPAARYTEGQAVEVLVTDFATPGMPQVWVPGTVVSVAPISEQGHTDVMVRTAAGYMSAQRVGKRGGNARIRAAGQR